MTTDGDRPHGVVEDRDLLRDAVVEDGEVLLRQVRHETAGRVGHGDVERHGLRARPEGRLLGAERHRHAEDECRREPTTHASSLADRLGPCPVSGLRFAAAVALTAALLPVTPTAQVRPVYSRGVAGLVQALERLRTTASAMHTAAHPDDEDTALIARLARGDHARVAYLSLNRGEGGQNIIGTELFDALGVIRTEELLQARTPRRRRPVLHPRLRLRLHQDAGGSRRRSGTTRSSLGDMVRAIRRYRPLVILNGWSGTPADGHGQHQLAGDARAAGVRRGGRSGAVPRADRRRPAAVAGEEAVRAARLRAPIPRRATLRLPTGTLDPVLGRSYFEIAMEGRSQHKSQEMGVIEGRGAQDVEPAADHEPDASPQRALEPRDRETSVFDGIDTSLIGLAALAGLPKGALATELAAMDAAAAEALASADIVRAPAKLVPVLARGLAAARAARTAAAALSAPADARAEADFLLALKVARVRGRAGAGVAGSSSTRSPIARSPPPATRLRVNVNVFQPDGRRSRPAPARSSSPRDGPRRRRRRRPKPRAAAPSRASSASSRRATEPWQVTVAADAPPTAAVLAAHAPHRPRVHLDRRADRAADAAVRSAGCRRARAADHRRRGRDRRAAGRLSLRRLGPRRDPPRRRDRAGGDRRLRRDAGDRADRRARRSRARSVSACAARRCRQGPASCACCRPTAGR